LWIPNIALLQRWTAAATEAEGVRKAGSGLSKCAPHENDA
jgi:hypothetical protein